MVEVSVLVDKLNSLDTSLDVYSFLKGQGVKGERQSANACVINNWMKRESGCQTVTTSFRRIKVWSAIPFDNTDAELIESYEVEPQISNFIRNFDEGMYEDLEKQWYEQMPKVSETAWNWAVSLTDYQIVWFLRLLSDDPEYLPGEYTQVLLWRAADRLKMYEEGNRRILEGEDDGVL